MKIKIIWKEYRSKLVIVFFDETVKYPNVVSAIKDMKRRYGFNELKTYKAIQKVFETGKYSGIECTYQELRRNKNEI